MNNSKLRESLAGWLNLFEEISGPVASKDKLISYLASRIEGEVFIEKDPDVISIKKDGKTQYARVDSENRATGTVSLTLLDDRSQMMLTYAALKGMSPGAEIATALDSLRET